MNIYHDFEREKTLWKTGSRQHPWTVGTNHPEFRYYDFIKHPELISTSLEDFVPYAHHQAIQTFYEILRWVNGPDSIFETNDCGMRFQKSKTTSMADKLEIDGRLMIFFRDKMLNLDGNLLNTFGQILWNEIIAADPNFDLGHFAFATCPTTFIELPPPHNKTQTVTWTVYFWSWGDDEDEIFENLDRTFKALFQALKITSDLVKKHLA